MNKDLIKLLDGYTIVEEKTGDVIKPEKIAKKIYDIHTNFFNDINAKHHKVAMVQLRVIGVLLFSRGGKVTLNKRFEKDLPEYFNISRSEDKKDNTITYKLNEVK